MANRDLQRLGIKRSRLESPGFDGVLGQLLSVDWVKLQACPKTLEFPMHINTDFIRPPVDDSRD